MFFKLPKQEIIQQDNMQASDRAAMKKESKRLFIIVIILVIMFFAALAAIFLFRPVSGEVSGGVYGNTSGNLANSGWVAESNRWIYYSSAADDFSLYKVRADGSEKAKLNDMFTHNINVYDGWVYYLAPKDKEGAEELLAEYGVIKPALYKTRTDGTETVKVSDKTNSFVITDGWIYFKNVGDGTIKKMRTDGTQLTHVTDDQTNEIAVSDGWIYYSSRNEGYGLYKIRTNGTEKTKLSDGYMVSVNALDGWVYYVNVDAEDAYLPICKMRADGTEKTMLTDSGGYYINVAGGWIYYWSAEDGSLHKMRTDGTGDVILSGSKGIMVNIAGGWVYYQYSSPDIEQYASGSVELYREKLDGTENQLVE